MYRRYQPIAESFVHSPCMISETMVAAVKISRRRSLRMYVCVSREIINMQNSGPTSRQLKMVK